MVKFLITNYIKINELLNNQNTYLKI